MELTSLLTTFLPALLSPIMDVVKMGFSKLFGYSLGEPKTFDEFVKLHQADTERLKSLAALDNPSGQVSRWVADLRGSFRYIAIGLILIFTLSYYVFVSVPNKEILTYLGSLSQSCIFFIIGDRVYLGLKHQK